MVFYVYDLLNNARNGEKIRFLCVYEDGEMMMMWDECVCVRDRACVHTEFSGLGHGKADCFMGETCYIATIV